MKYTLNTGITGQVGSCPADLPLEKSGEVPEPVLCSLEVDHLVGGVSRAMIELKSKTVIYGLGA